MEKGYFNTTLTSQEVALARYVCNYVKQKEPKNGLNLVRLAKILVHATLKLKLPIRLFWYDMGLLSVVQPQVPVNYSYNAEKDIIEQVLDFKGTGKLDEAIDEGIGIYSADLDIYEIRRKQYEFLKDPLYLTKLEIEEFIENAFLFNEKDKFLDLISKLIIHVPEDVNYKDLNEILKKFAVLSNSLLTFCNANKVVSMDIIKSLESIIGLLNGLNATFKRLKGYEDLFTSETKPRDLDQKLWNANSSLLVLKKDLSENIPSDSITLEPFEAEVEEIYSDFIEILVT